jgi:hypothetical protein
MTTVLDWAEKAGIENMKDHVNNADLILKQASTLLTLLLSGAGAALYFGMSHSELRLVAITVSLWLFFLATILTLKCLMFDDFPSIWNEPQNLNIKGYSLERLRQYELENLQTRIKKAILINSKKSKRLNNCIFAACATPIVGAVSWFVSVFHFCA